MINFDHDTWLKIAYKTLSRQGFSSTRTRLCDTLSTYLSMEKIMASIAKSVISKEQVNLGSINKRTPEMWLHDKEKGVF